MSHPDYGHLAEMMLPRLYKATNPFSRMALTGLTASDCEEHATGPAAPTYGLVYLTIRYLG